jgi:hypothetical protein
MNNNEREIMKEISLLFNKNRMIYFINDHVPNVPCDDFHLRPTHHEIRGDDVVHDRVVLHSCDNIRLELSQYMDAPCARKVSSPEYIDNMEL